MCGRFIGNNYIFTKNKQNYGASTFFEMSLEKYTEKNIVELLENVIPEKDTSEVGKESRQRKVKVLINKSETTMWYSYGPFSKERTLILDINFYPSCAVGAYNFNCDENRIQLNFPVNIDYIPLREKGERRGDDPQFFEKIKFYLKLMENVFNHFQCEHGWGDNFDYQLKFQGKDPRRDIFGVNYYGKKLVNEIGREKLISVKDCIINEMPWGGIILQLAENPYIDISKEKRIEIKNILWGTNE